MTETLYAETHKIRYKSQENEDRQRYIKITVEVQTTTSPIHRKDLIVRLTDNEDHFFLYSLCLGEEDFQSLKTQQGLLVDFGAFPQKFIALLKLCGNEQDNEVPKFLLNFKSNNSSSIGSGQLLIVETNPFKHLTHLTLHFSPGNDSDVKKYLASCLKKSMDDNERLESRLKFTENDLGNKLNNCKRELDSTVKELESLRSLSSGQTEKLSMIHAQDINSEREKALKMHTELQQRLDREKREIESSLQKNISQLETKLKESEDLNKELTDRRYRAEATIRELKAKLSSCEEELRRSRQELQHTRKENSALEAERHNQDKNLQQLKTRVAVLEQELIDKEQLVERISTSIETTQEQKQHHEQRIKDQNGQIKKLENTIKTMSDELIKGNEIIKRLQSELRGYMGKVKMKNEVTTRQEKLISEKEIAAEKVNMDLQKKSDELKARNDEVAKLKDQLETTLKKLEESKEVLKTNENVINWLNKQLNDKQVTRNAGTRNEISSAHSIPSFKSGQQNMPNYSTPIGSSPHALVIPSNLGASPAVHPASRFMPQFPTKIPQVQYNSEQTNQGYSPKNSSRAGAGGIDSKYLSASSENAKQPLQELNANRQMNNNISRKNNVPGMIKSNMTKQPPIVSSYFSGSLPKPQTS